MKADDNSVGPGNEAGALPVSPQMDKCEGCSELATTFDVEGVPLCMECAALPPNEPRGQIIKALEAAARLNTGQGCPNENHAIAVLAMDALHVIKTSEWACRWMDMLTEEIALTVTEIKESRYAFSRTSVLEKLRDLHLRLARRLKGTCSNENQPSPILSEEQLTITRLSSELEQAQKEIDFDTECINRITLRVRTLKVDLEQAREALRQADRSFITIRNAPGTTLNPHHISQEAYEAHTAIRFALTAASPRPEQTCIECGRGIGQLHKPKCGHTGRFLVEKEADVSANDPSKQKCPNPEDVTP